MMGSLISDAKPDMIVALALGSYDIAGGGGNDGYRRCKNYM